MSKELLFGIASLGLNLFGYIPYIRGVLKGKIKPQRITWGIWTVLLIITFINQILNGGGYSVLFLGSTAILVFITFILSIRKGVGGATKFDKIILTSSLILFIYWILVRDTRTSTIIATLIDLVGALPTVIKAYKAPSTEAYLQWIMAALGGLLGMLSITTSDYILYVYPTYVFAMNSIIVSAKFFGEQSIARKK